ncbi:cytochrome b561 domain-containing 2 [Chlorella sorokiniana]|jgi:cytochrome b-561 domain-containing protein 2|uniref:Cytochrome b561 domain-containing 2 n=1 Tax=Chlorella sorokiniana TaxID=3076 RepID=A0A2P6TPE8_CHLSO|nr:cytochrome b561 domain-containing 2 [Chlorella sorokiniana]|eukprot:PRW55908.1 cytochrome b561 domain-containing 2 [Chlorella sorokiniana]
MASAAAPVLDRPIQTLSITLCVAIALAMLPAAYEGQLFAWHPLFLVLGFLGFMTEGIMAAVRFRPNEGLSRVQAITNHAIIQSAATACIAMGLYAIYHNKNLKGKQHFTSLHGKVGLCTFLLALAAPLLGAASFRRLGIIQRFPEPWQPRIKWLHRLISVYAHVLAVVTMLLALPHPAVLTGAWSLSWQVGVIVLSGCMLYTLRGRIGMKTVLPASAGGSAAALSGPKHK